MNQNFIKVLNIISFSFFLYVVSNINIDYLSIYIDSIRDNLIFIFLAISMIILSNFIIGLTWANYIKKELGLNYSKPLYDWLNSFKGKFVPGKITSPILRISDKIYVNRKNEFYFSIFIENIYLVLGNIYFGSYLLLKNFYGFNSHLIVYFLINILIFTIRKNKIFKFNLSYLNHIFIIQFTNIFYFLGIYFSLRSLEFTNSLEIALLYQLIVGVSMFISIIPAGIGLREFGAIELNDLINLKIINLEFIVVFLRFFILFCDFIIILVSSLFNLIKIRK